MANQITTQDEWDKMLVSPGKRFCLVSADWHPPSQQLIKLLTPLNKQFSNINFFYILLDQHKTLLTKGVAQVTSVPTLLFFENDKLKAKSEESRPVVVRKLVENWSKNESLPPNFIINRKLFNEPEEEEEKTEEKLNKLLEELTTAEPVMLFIKGTKFSPFCQFSKSAVNLLNNLGVDFGTFDILSDMDVRAGLKVYSDWPTYPQLYINGEFIGGIDIMREMYEDGSLVGILPPECTHQPDDDIMENYDVENILNNDKMVLFVEDNSRSSRIKKSLSNNITFATYNVSQNNKLRQEIERRSGSTHFPQLFIAGLLFADYFKLENHISKGEEGLLSEVEFYLTS